MTAALSIAKFSASLKRHGIVQRGAGRDHITYDVGYFTDVVIPSHLSHEQALAKLLREQRKARRASVYAAKHAKMYADGGAT